MNDQEILKRREELQEELRRNREEWQAYDKRFPVIPGAYKPPNYWEQQRWFSNRSVEISHEIDALGRTGKEKLRLILTWGMVLVVILGAVLLIWRPF
jgi:hypothetical protein